MDGRAVNEFDPTGKAAAEMNKLWQLTEQNLMAKRPAFDSLKKTKPSGPATLHPQWSGQHRPSRRRPPGSRPRDGLNRDYGRS